MTFIDPKRLHTALVILLTLAAAGALHAGGGHGHDGDDADAPPTGEHGGRLLRDGDFELELAIVEDGMPPEFRAWARRDDRPLDPAAIDLEVRLERLGGDIDVVRFAPADGFLRGRETVSEPHSFDVEVIARHDGRDYRWRYASHEGRTRINAQIAEDAGIATERVGSATLRRTLALTGRVRPDPQREARVAARFPGTVQSVVAGLYQRVRAGDTLATIEARDSLRRYAVRAPIDGVVIERHATPGAAAGDAPLFVLADLSRVWVTLDAFADDLAQVETGQTVAVHDLDGEVLARGEVADIAPTSGPRQNVHLRVPVANPDGRLRPGQFVRARVTVERREVERAVKRTALQRFRDFDVVYARYGDTYEVRMLELGARDDTWVEVLGGIDSGTEYVTENSFLIRADIEKSGASHDH